MYKGRTVRVIEFRDITDIKAAENAHKSSEANFKELFELSPIGLALCDMDGQLVMLNPAYSKIIGYTIEETLKLTYWQITPQKHLIQETQQLDKLNQTGFFGPYEKEYIHKNGHLVPVRLNGMLVERDGVQFIWSSIEDITQLKAAEHERNDLIDQLRQSQKMEAIGTLAGGIAHDLNNLLSPVIGYAELMSITPERSAKDKKALISILDAGFKARDLVRQLLAFSRKQTLEFINLNMKDVLLDLENLLRSTIREDIELYFSYQSSIPAISADKSQLEQVIMNLAINAQDAMPNGGVLSIDLQTINKQESPIPLSVDSDLYISLSVTDTGLGMSDDIVNQIFEPFFSTKGDKGTGLGLATVYGIIKQHSGNIKVYSDQSEGTTIRIFLPTSPTDILHPSPNNSKNQEKSQGKETILLVEDDDRVRDMTESILEEQGYRILSADSGTAALNLLHIHQDEIDLLLTDVVMPNINGKQLYEQALQVKPLLKVLYMSGYNNDIISHDSILNEGINFIQKPFTLYDLATKIRGALDN